MTHSPQQIRALLERAGTKPRRSLGQNFVGDPNTVRRIARLAEVAADDLVVEIGPGLGSLTLALCEVGARVIAIEVDPTLSEILRDVTDASSVTVVTADALGIDWVELLPSDAHAKVVANLPYNIGTSILLDVLARAPMVDSLLIMVQQEVAQRLVAGPGSKTYGIPSVKLAWWADAEIIGTVPPTVFVPQPRVESSLIKVVRHGRQPSDVSVQQVGALVDTAFGQRRKMLRRSLAEVVTESAYAEAGVPPTARPEAVGLEGWIALARAASAGSVRDP